MNDTEKLPRTRTGLPVPRIILSFFIILALAWSPALAATIVLDPGHGGADGGASDGGEYAEKDFTLSLARKIADRLAPAYRVELTRGSDIVVAPEDRAAVANHLRADLFISMHAAVAPYCGPRSAALYYHSDEHLYRPPEPSPSETVDKSIRPRLWDRQQLQHQPQSLQLAAAMKTSLLDHGFERVTIEPAPLVVLMGVDAPAVLVEVGCFHPSTSPDRAALEKRLDAYADGIAAAIEAGLDRLKR